MTMTLEIEQEEQQTEPLTPAAMFAKLREQEVAGVRESTVEWQALIVAVADGTAGDLAEVQATLSRAGRTTDDLEKAVRLLKERRGWARDMAAAKTAEATIEWCQREIATAEASWNIFQRQHESVVVPLNRTQADAINALSVAFYARTRLLQTCSDPAALAVLAELDQRMKELRHAMPELKSRADTKRRALKGWIDSEDAGYAADIERVTAEVAEMDAQYETWRQECARINHEYTLAQTEYACDPAAI